MSGRTQRDRRQAEAEHRRARAAAARRRRLLIGATVTLLLGLTVAAVLAVRATGSPPAPSASASAAPGAPQPLAGLDAGATGAPVDGIECQTMEQAVFHVHAHLAIYVDGRQRVVPAGIGITAPRQEQQTASGAFVSGGGCLYWLHSHTADGLIHIEAPEQRTFTLGHYFDIWGEALGPAVVGPEHGHVTAYVDGRPWAHDPRIIPLVDGEVIQLDVRDNVPPQPYTFPAGL